mgnify:CR=1 FL=1
MQKNAARALWKKSGGYNEACNTRTIVSTKADLKTLLSSTISYIDSVLDLGARTAGQMTMLLGAFDDEKVATVDGNGLVGAAKKRSLKDALGEVHEEFQAKLRKANGEPDALVNAEAT